MIARIHGEFRDQLIAAPLKPIRVRDGIGDRPRIPRSADRGPIEAGSRQNVQVRDDINSAIS